MLPVQEIVKSLPPPREDEPSSLRQDIVDEILDHLQCGLRRELLVHGGDEHSAKQRVLNHFGDPQQIARRLWFQAMWSKIMTQRLVVGSTIFSMLVSASLVVMVGLMVQQIGLQQREQHQVNAALIEQLSRLVPQPSTPPAQRDLRWNNLKVKVTKENKDGPAAKGYQIIVSRQPRIGEVIQNVQQHYAAIDESGIADCGFVEPGIYRVGVTTPWFEQSQVTFTIHPGNDHLEQIVAPQQPLELTGVKLNVDGVPDSPKSTRIAVFVQFKETGSRKIANRDWQMMPVNYGQVGGSSPSLLIVPQHGVWVSEGTIQPPEDFPRNYAPGISGQLVTPDEAAAIGPFRPHSTPGIEGQPFTWQRGSPPEVAQRSKWKKLDSSDVFKLPVNQYVVEFSVILLNGSYGPADSSYEAPNLGAVPTDLNSEVSPDDATWPSRVSSGGWPAVTWRHSPINLAAELGKLNEWAITLPEDVAEILRRGFSPTSLDPSYPTMPTNQGTPTYEPAPFGPGRVPTYSDPVPDAYHPPGNRSVPDPNDSEEPPKGSVPKPIDE